MLRAVVLLAFAGLTACFPSNKSVMDSWIGTRDTDLVSKWGAPTRETTLSDASRVMTWESVVNDYFAGPHICSRSFTVSSTGVVKSWASHGCPD